MRNRQILPNGLAVMSDLYLDHLIYVAMIAAALFGGAYLLAP
jgi:hypothetical protein